VLDGTVSATFTFEKGDTFTATHDVTFTDGTSSPLTIGNCPGCPDISSPDAGWVDTITKLTVEIQGFVVVVDGLNP